MLTLLTAMLHKMDKVLVAEGVETEEALDMVRQIGIDRFQGFYFSVPMPSDAFLALVGDDLIIEDVSKTVGDSDPVIFGY